MKVHQLISNLERLAKSGLGNADVLFAKEGEEPVSIEGGIASIRGGRVLLSPIKLDKVGGF